MKEVKEATNNDSSSSSSSSVDFESESYSVEDYENDGNKEELKRGVEGDHTDNNPHQDSNSYEEIDSTNERRNA